MNEREYLKWVASLPCLRCTRSNRSNAAHLYKEMNKTLANKSGYVVPLCCDGLYGLGCHKKHDQHLEIEYWDKNHERAINASIQLRERAFNTHEGQRIIAKYHAFYD